MRWFWKPKPQAPDLPEQLLREIRRSFEDAAADEEHFPRLPEPYGPTAPLDGTPGGPSPVRRRAVGHALTP